MKEKNLLKIIGCFLIAVSCFACINIKAITTDVEPPVLDNISFKDDNLKYTCGDKIYLNIDAHDAVSGIDKEDIWIHMNKGICKDEGNVCSNGGLKVYYDENNKAYINVSNACYNGEYLITSIIFRDKLDNTSVYTFNGNNTHFGTTYTKVEEVNKTLKFEITGGEDRKTNPIEEVKENEKWETNPPILESFEIVQEKIKYGEKLVVRAKITDKESGVDGSYVKFTSKNGNKELPEIDVTLLSKGNDIYEGEFFVESGTGVYYLNSITLYDKLRNYSVYFTDKNRCLESGDDDNWMCDLEQKEIEIEKIEGYIPALQRDARAETIKINKSKYSVPSYGEVELTVSASVLLSDTARITFVNENNNRIDTVLFNVGNNTYKGDIKINQYANVGKYKLATIRLYRQDNKEPYYYVYTNDLGDKYEQNAKTGDLELDLEFEVYANNTPDVITGTQAENLLESIKNAKDDAIIYVDATNDSIIKKEVFEAIKGTNKELHIESSGIEWIFKGKDIINPKQIDTSISVLFDYNYNKTNMKDYIDKSVVILFKDNGELPGISTIRIKLDYVFRSYIGNKIYVYYYNENSKFEEVTGKELEISENGYFEFNIKHNSTYVMSSNKPDNKYISKSKELVKINTSIKEENNNIDYKLIYISLAVVIVLIIVIAIIINLNNKKKKINIVNNINNDINNINNN